MRRAILLLSFAILFSIPGCRPRAIKQVPPLAEYQHVSEKRGVLVGVAELSHADAQAIFGTDPRSYGYAVLVLDITNNTSHSLTMYPSYIDLSRSSGKSLSREYHYDTYQWAVAGGVLAALFWWPAIPFVIVPAALGMRSYNKKITRDIRMRTLGPRDILHVGPYERVRRFIIIPSDYAWRGSRLRILDDATG